MHFVKFNDNDNTRLDIEKLVEYFSNDKDSIYYLNSINGESRQLLYSKEQTRNSDLETLDRLLNATDVTDKKLEFLSNL